MQTPRILLNFLNRKYGIDSYTPGRFDIRHCSETVGYGGLVKELFYIKTCKIFKLCEQEKLDFSHERAQKCKRMKCPIKKCNSRLGFSIRDRGKIVVTEFDDHVEVEYTG